MGAVGKNLPSAVVVAACSWAVLGAASPAAHAASPAHCAAGDRTEPALQGQVPVRAREDGSAAEGYWCNLQLVGERADTSFANFDVYRDCAYYTNNVTSAVVPGVDGDAGSHGVVLDVSDPAHPVQTDTLSAMAMQNGGESLRVNTRRGLLVSDYYSNTQNEPLTPVQRSFAVYSVKDDCRHPKLLADVIMPTQGGHEGCFAPDGDTYYMSNGATSVTPIDLRDPAHPHELTTPWGLPIHGCSIADDGRTGYFASTLAATMYVLDTSQAQAGTPGAGYQILGRFPTPDAQFEQATYPLTYHGRPYVLLWSEATLPPKLCDLHKANFGYARILDMADRSAPREVSRIQTEVMLPQNCGAVQSDISDAVDGAGQGALFPGVVSAVFLYDTHMCTPDRLHDPTILACAQFGSGLRVYDIRDPAKPSEIAYYNTGTVSPQDPALDLAIARPVIRSDLGQIWWVTNTGGFHVAQFRKGVWPFAGMNRCPSGSDYFLAQYDADFKDCRRGETTPAPARCQDRRVVRIRLPRRARRVVVRGNGQRIRTLRHPGRVLRLDLREAPAGRHRVRIRIRLADGRVRRITRTFHLCARPQATSSADSPQLRRATDQVLLLCHVLPR